MSLDFCILGSGSSGNCALLRTPDGLVMIDAGIGPRTTARRMANTGATLADLRAICLTHLDSDHFRRNWFTTVRKRRVTVFCHESRHAQLSADAEPFEAASHVSTFNGHHFSPAENLTFRAIPLAHDAAGSHGFVIEGFGLKIGYATDLGHVPAHLLDAFCGVDVLALESNYDPDMQRNSGRPCFLQHRIMGGRGHLSNQQALDAIKTLLDRCRFKRKSLPQHIVLLHRSQQCNCPKLLRDTFECDPRIASRLTLAEPYTWSGWLKLRDRTPFVGEQMGLFA